MMATPTGTVTVSKCKPQTHTFDCEPKWHLYINKKVWQYFSPYFFNEYCNEDGFTIRPNEVHLAVDREPQAIPQLAYKISLKAKNVEINIRPGSNLSLLLILDCFNVEQTQWTPGKPVEGVPLPSLCTALIQGHCLLTPSNVIVEEDEEEEVDDDENIQFVKHHPFYTL